MIPNLSLRNFKGVSASYSFAAGNYIHGPNFAGKTAIDQAIRCLVLGYVPGVAKTAAGLRQFASDLPMSVSADPVLGQRLAVAFDRVKNAVKQTEDATLAGKLDEATTVLFDPSTFFNLADSARISKAAELVRASEISVEAVNQAVEAVLSGSPVYAIKAKDRLWKADILKATTVPDLLPLWENLLKAEKKALAEVRVRMQKTVEGVSDLSAGGAVGPGIEEVDRKIAAIENRLREIHSLLQGSLDRETARRRYQQQVESLRPHLGKLPKLKARLETLKSSVLEARERLDSARATAQGLQAELQGHEANAKRAELAAKARAEHERVVAGRAEHEEQLKRRIALVADHEKVCEALDEQIDEVRSQIMEAEEAQRQEAVSDDGWQSVGDDWAPEPDTSYIVQAIGSHDGTRWSIEKIIAIRNPAGNDEDDRMAKYEAEQHLAGLREKLASLGKERDSWAKEIRECEDARVVHERAIAEAERSQRMLATFQPEEARAVDLESIRAQLRSVNEEQAKVQRELAAVETDYDATNRNYFAAESAEKTFASLVEPAAPLSEEENRALVSEREGASAKLTELRNERDGVIRLQQDQKRIADAAAQREQLEGDIKVINAALDLVAQKKVELVAGSIEGPLAVANKLAAGILKGPLVFEEGVIGMRQGQNFVSSRVFSGTESAITMMGLTAGLAAKSALRVLILDEVARLDAKNAEQLVKNLQAMVSDGDIDQFILIGPTNETLAAVPGLNVISL